MMTKHKSPNKSSDDNQEMEVEGGISNDDDDDDDDASKTEDHKKPEVFQSKSNLEIVAWLVDHLEILRLALEMNNVAISLSSKITDDKFVYGTKVSKEFKEIRKNRASTGSLSQKELIDYVDEEFVQKILSRQLVAVNISELTRNGGFDILVDFVRETFKVSWNGKNLSAVKELDNITKELTIPSRSGNKIVDSLSL
ncbi:uncharacterized protein OCT59_010433 [Rhizophagus irregularis]|uniref:uncharacterized protein n=1 Tax=Rhizophagus irregularis TaxID=588596 RepID=UPI00332D48C8|nr:hypothetical protein OCT59_010433 [Rhizophagus irregularis]